MKCWKHHIKWTHGGKSDGGGGERCVAISQVLEQSWASQGHRGTILAVICQCYHVMITLMMISLTMNLPAGVTQNRWKELNWLSLKVEVKSMRMKQNPSRWSWSSNVCPYIINEELCHSNYRFADPKENSFSTANVGMSAIGALRYAGQNIGWDCEKNWGFTVWGCCCLLVNPITRDTRRLLSQFSILGGYLAAPTQPSMSLY